MRIKGVEYIFKTIKFLSNLSQSHKLDKKMYIV